ncbi:hypothetical protein FRB95_011625 [Tulasnella sp. JGI-2019a]|nr:hypothetical protein FRB95_011625 [Tulasnella sp. JGI-2019a]
MVKQLSEITGKTVTYKEVTSDEYVAAAVAGGYPQRIALELSEMYQGIAELGYFGGTEIGNGNGKDRLPVGVEGAFTWAEWVKATDWSKILA